MATLARYTGNAGVVSSPSEAKPGKFCILTMNCALQVLLSAEQAYQQCFMLVAEVTAAWTSSVSALSPVAMADLEGRKNRDNEGLMMRARRERPEGREVGGMRGLCVMVPALAGQRTRQLAVRLQRLPTELSGEALEEWTLKAMHVRRDQAAKGQVSC
ncbi:unnamed protein product [Symbiodinium natans]|uniref:Uncharacterized protein n=1 Tax=Symbiodinium natans TaxID=878477 RepID=A0A812GKF7_9DINO|nr:unnamed protein product [Symbiodinium natans]